MQPSLHTSYRQLYDKFPAFYYELLYRIVGEVERYSGANFCVAIRLSLSSDTQSIEPNVILVNPGFITKNAAIVSFAVAREAGLLLQPKELSLEDKYRNATEFAIKFIETNRYDMFIVRNYYLTAVEAKEELVFNESIRKKPSHG